MRYEGEYTSSGRTGPALLSFLFLPLPSSSSGGVGLIPGLPKEGQDRGVARSSWKSVLPEGARRCFHPHAFLTLFYIALLFCSGGARPCTWRRGGSTSTRSTGPFLSWPGRPQPQRGPKGAGSSFLLFQCARGSSWTPTAAPPLYLLPGGGLTSGVGRRGLSLCAS